MKEIFLLLLLTLRARAAQFTLQYIGDSLNVEEAKTRDFCENKYCVADSELLFYAATQNASVDPCVDFKEFSMGTFIKDRAFNDRYSTLGFQHQAEKDHEERLRKLLASKIEENDPRVFKVMKNFFRKCVDSRNVVKNGTNEIIDYLKSLGGSPIINGENWDPSKFNVSKIIQQDPLNGIFHLLGYTVETKVRKKNEDKLVHLKRKPIFFTFKGLSWDGCDCGEEVSIKRRDPEKRIYTQYNDMLTELFEFYKYNSSHRKAVETKIEKAVESIKAFDEEFRKLNATSEDTILKVKDIKSYAPNLSIDWLQFINDQLLYSDQITEDEEIVLNNPEKLKSLSAALATIDKGIIADAFVLKFLYIYRMFFIVYPFDWVDEETSSNKKALQRWQQCLDFVQYHMRPALEVMLLTYHDIDKENIKNFTNGAIHDFAESVKKMSECVLKKEVKEAIVERLSNVKILLGFFESNYSTKQNNEKLESYYEELTLKGDDSLVESVLDLRNFYKRISNEDESNKPRSKISIDTTSKKFTVWYYAGNNVLYIPASLTFYPWYHPDRPRFFNQATLYVDIIGQLKTQTALYIREVYGHNLIRFLNQTDDLKLAYDSYVSWESNGGKELLLGANRLTTHQLFWLALARTRYVKTKRLVGEQDNAEKSDYDKTVFTYNYAYYDLDSFKTIKEDFHCKVKYEVVKTTDSCDANAVLLAPYKNFVLIIYKYAAEKFNVSYV